MNTERQNVFVVFAIDDDYRVKECLVVTDVKVASQLRVSLSEIWGGSRVGFASRFVDDVPVFNLRNLVNQQFDAVVRGLEEAR